MLVPTASFNPATNGLQGADNIEDRTVPSIFEVYAWTVLFSTACLESESLPESPKEPLINLWIFEGG